ncbi:MAG: NAD+ synthase [Euryarchaeota archaeon]|nr:NAD+ synthase [Euryarchaeota archaeon]
MRLNPREEELERARREIVSFIRREVEEAGAEGGVIGISGGVDSALTAALAREALGDKLLALIMPERGVTREEDVRDAEELASELGIEYHVVEISESVAQVLNSFPLDAFPEERRKLAVANIKPRLRMLNLYLAANLSNRLVIGTGNRTELLLGYFTKYGDGGVDLLPIGGLYKTQVRALAGHVGIPERIIRKTPSAGLWRGQEDEAELGMSYSELDRILHALYEERLSPEQAAERLGVGVEKVRAVEARVKANEHKRRMPRIPELRW